MNSKKVFFTYRKDESGEINLNRVCIYDADSRKIDAEKFDIEKHRELFESFLRKANINGETLVTELEEKGLFNEEDITREKLKNYISSENNFDLPVEQDDTKTDDEPVEEDDEEKEPIEPSEFDAEDEYVEDDNKDSKVGKRVLAGVLAAGAVVGTLTLLHSCDQEKIVDETKEQTLEDLLNQMTSEQKAFFESSFKAVETFNNNATKDGNFALEKDESKLHMSVDEGIALNILMNNYSSDELYDIFGTVKFDTTNLMNLARSAYGKLSTYYMNAKEPSGLADMINDEVAREFFSRHENAVIEFNNNPSFETADTVIKAMYKDYTYNGSNGEYTSINNDGVAWFATTPAFGYELANRNIPEFLKTTDGLSLNQVTTNELLTGINEEINLDIMDELDNKSLCASVTIQTRDKIDSLTMKQNIAITIIETNAKDELIEGLRENGDINLANKILANDITPELLKEISQSSSKNNQLVDEYKDRLNSLEERETKIIGMLNLAQEKYNSKEGIDLAELINNRFRSPLVVEKEPVVDNTPGVTTEEEKKEQLQEDLYVGEDKNGTPVYDGDKLNELPEEEKEEFIQDNGVVINKETEVVEKEEVKLEDLTHQEQEQVIDQEAILREIEAVKNDLITRGVYDAINYTEAIGAYSYNGTIIIPYNGQQLDTSNMSLFNITAYDYAFGTEGIDYNQIKGNIGYETLVDELNSLSNDAKEYLQDEYGSNWAESFIQESYVYGYEQQIEGSLSEARNLGAQIRQEAEKEYNKSQTFVDKKNEDVSKVTKESIKVETPGIYASNDMSENNLSYDPTLDTNYGMQDEQPYVLNPVIETNNTVVQTTNEYDPNLDSNFSMPNEQPYVSGLNIEVPSYYVEDADLENAFNTSLSEGSSSKVK